MKRFLLVLFTCLTGVAFADSGGASNAVSGIHTYGGGEFLQATFEAIGRILYGDADSGIGQTFRALVRIALLIGGFCCVCLAFFRQRFEPFLRNFLLPGLVVVAFLLIPRTTVTIRDHSMNQNYKVEQVPFLLGKFAEFTSEGLYRLQRLIEEPLETHAAYRWTRPMEGADALLQPNGASLQHPELTEDLREFCKECVVRDVGIGLYSERDLADAGDLGAFLEEHTSKRREVFVKQWLTCQAAAKALSEEISKEPVSRVQGIKPLLGLDDKKTKEENRLFKQRIWIDGLSPKTEAKGETWHRSLLASITALPLFLEAFLYITFPLVTLLALLSFGVRVLIQWLKLVLWVKLWPVFFCIADTFLQFIWEFRKQSLFGAKEVDLTLGSAGKLADLFQSMELLACVAVAAIPILLWLLVKGGCSQIAQFAGSFLPPSPTGERAQQERVEGQRQETDRSRQSFSAMVFETDQAPQTAHLAERGLMQEPSQETEQKEAASNRMHAPMNELGG